MNPWQQVGALAVLTLGMFGTLLILRRVLGSGQKSQEIVSSIFSLTIVLAWIILSIQFFQPQSVTVTIEYNIGEIILGILGGSGAAAGGIAYAVSTLRERG